MTTASVDKRKKKDEQQQQHHAVSFSLHSLLTFDGIHQPSMKIDRSKLPPKAKLCTYFGHEVAFQSRQDGGRHLTCEDLEPHRLIGDEPLDDLLEFMEQQNCPLKAGDDLLSSSSTTTNRRPLVVQARIEAFLSQCRKVPAWVDWDQLKRGQDVFIRFTPAASMALYYRCLCPGFSVPKIAKVIMATKYLAPPSTPEQVAMRLIDTGAMVNECMRGGGGNALTPDSIGWKTCLHVRVLHAKVRRSLLKGDWNTQEYGVPINQEDLSATLLSFGINTLKGIEFAAGMPLKQQDQEDYIALWRYIGWLLGIPTNDTDDSSTTTTMQHLDPCGPGNLSAPDPIAHSVATFQSIILHLLKPDTSSVTVCHHLLKCGRPQRGTAEELKPTTTTKKSNSSNDDFLLRALLCRYYIGDPLADALELPLASSPTIVQAKAYLYLWMIRLFTWAAMLPLVRPLLVLYYKRGMHYFHTQWTERHPTRMAKAVGSSCPFAMITKQQ